MRLALQCIAAEIASLAVPVAASLWVLSADPVMNADASIDDAPERAAMLFLFASPVFFAFLAVFFAGSAALLRYLGQVSLLRLLLVNLGVALLVGIAFAHQGYSSFGARDAFISFGLFGLFSFVSLALGSSAWWLLRFDSAHS